MRQVEPDVQRLRAVIRGAVQGVGFRPFVYRLATEAKLAGWVMNSGSGVIVEVEGERETLERFALRLEHSNPPSAMIHSTEFKWLDAAGFQGFAIRESDDRDARNTLILPDLAPCGDCQREIFDPSDRRYRYPFTNCTNCGPRFSIIEALPYDRVNTSMRRFPMCPACEREYGDPLDRRFQAQATACPACGPQLELWGPDGRVIERASDALDQAVEQIRAGQIVALKGVGGFQLLVDARSEAAVTRLRARKHREEKPFAVMYPSEDAVRRDCDVSELEARWLRSAEAPILLLERQRAAGVAESVAPQNPLLGVMLPSTPLHHLLMADLGFPVVATSGNLNDEPICVDEHEALERLRGMADVFLVHERPVVRHIDDSIVRVMCGREVVLRRARGFAPLPVILSESMPPILGVGAHLKNTVALSVDTGVFMSQHIGDLATAEAHMAFRKAATDLPRLYKVEPEWVACDLHPDYLSTQYAASQSARVHRVQHHWAHLLACMAENELEPPVLGIVWDGTGLGVDGTIWGGEFLLARDDGFERVAHLRPFALPGGDAAAREPRRSALGILYEMFGADLARLRDLPPIQQFGEKEISLFMTMLQRHVNAPVTTSMGRLFDAVASLIGLRQITSFEGQAAMSLEFAITPGEDDSYPFEIAGAAPYVVEWSPMIASIIEDLRAGAAVGEIARRFHHTLSQVIVAVAEHLGEEKVLLTGGCFQNRYLLENSVSRLQNAGFRPYWHRRVPPNDGGIALGQIVSAVHSLHLRGIAEPEPCAAQ